MIYKDDCCFCNIASGKYKYENIDRPFDQNSSFFAIASIGALVEGWTLIIPKEHQFSMKNFYEKDDFKKITNNTISKLKQLYGPMIAFEHGSNKEGSITACGTNHAHLHLVPFKESLLMDLNKSNLKWVQCPVSKISQITQQSEYLFYCELSDSWDDPIGFVHLLDVPISQYFRRLIANKIGNLNEYDYKTYPYLDIAYNTQISLRTI